VFTTIETKVNVSRPIAKAPGRVRAEARVVSRRRRILSAEARVTDARGVGRDREETFFRLSPPR
jgi:acyl-coenzyme A thioesterase PaaI-like protein